MREKEAEREKSVAFPGVEIIVFSDPFLMMLVHIKKSVIHTKIEIHGTFHEIAGWVYWFAF